MTNLVPFPNLVENRLFVERINRGHHRESFRGESHLSELLARVEAGEEVIITRGNDPVARLAQIRKEADLQLLFNEVRAARTRLAPVSHDEVMSWRDEGRR